MPGASGLKGYPKTWGITTLLLQSPMESEKKAQRPLPLEPALVAYLGHYLQMFEQTLKNQARFSCTSLPVPSVQSNTASAPCPS